MNRPEIAARVTQALCTMFELDIDAVHEDSDLFKDLDLDSLDAIDLAVLLKTETGIKLTELEMRAIQTVGDIINVVYTQASANSLGQ